MTLEQDLQHLLKPQTADGCARATDYYRFASGDLPRWQRWQFYAHLWTCRACSSAHAEENPKPLRTQSFGWAVAAACAVALVCLIPKGSTDDLRMKGSPQLHVAVGRGAQSFSADPQTEIMPGDVVGFFYTSEQPVHLTLVAVTPDGEVTPIYRSSSPLPPGVQQRLELGGVITPEPKATCEWLVAFFSQRAPISTYQAQQAVRDTMETYQNPCRVGGQTPVVNVSQATSTQVIVLEYPRP